MNTSSILGLAGLIVVGVIIADFVANPTGTNAVAGGINSIFGTALSGLLGKPHAAPAKPANQRK
jgi:hypothetical protein